MLATLTTRFGIDRSFAAYVAVSAAALIADVLTLDRLLVAGVDESIAAAAGYSLGILVHWFLSTRMVFAAEAAAQGTAERGRQKALFVLSALVGLTLTTGIVGAGAAMGFDPRLAKLAAIGVSFFAVWLIRRLYIFAR
ncbi:MAG: GtrA family protein [Pacificimonas sp.]|jgi:putative flippase GtrA|nr:GtrA family protein [Pacificimonas sp.]